MKKRRLLYVSINDGTDTRINKEILTLSRTHHVTFIGMRQPDQEANRLPQHVSQVIIHGFRRSPLSILKTALAVYRQKPADYDSVHVINENLLLLLWPVLLTSRNLVLDIFDSTFLKFGSFVRRLFFPIQWFSYAVADVVIVTDDERRGLVPCLLREKVVVLPNYPATPRYLPPRRVAAPGDPIKIFFSGSLSNGRGVPFLSKLLKTDESVEVIAAGWIYDSAVRDLLAHPRASFLGVLSAEEAAQAARGCDFILCLYEPTVPNNIYASPNKIYDADLLGVPVIINAEVRVAGFVASRGLGLVIESYDHYDVVDVMARLRQFRDTRPHVDSAASPFRWEKVDDVLTSSHRT